jgi:hypothetical protein
MAFGRGAAPDDDDRSDDGTISKCQLSQLGNTLGRNHKVSSNDIDRFRVDEKFLDARVNLRILPLHSIQRSLRTQRL